jgi:hypothetical protein
LPFSACFKKIATDYNTDTFGQTAGYNNKIMDADPAKGML